MQLAQQAAVETGGQGPFSCVEDKLNLVFLLFRGKAALRSRTHETPPRATSQPWVVGFVLYRTEPESKRTRAVAFRARREPPLRVPPCRDCESTWRQKLENDRLMSVGLAGRLERSDPSGEAYREKPPCVVVMGTASPPPNLKETGFASCSCCFHPDCVPLHEHRLCSRWYFVRWASSSLAVPFDMVLELRARLGKRLFSVQPVWKTGVYEALVRVEPSGYGVEDVTSLLFPVSGSSFFDGERSTVCCLRCCWDTVRDSVPRWLSSSGAGGDVGTLGETELGKLLIDEIRQAAQGSGHT
ncbi:hypothetical protein VFPBJ_11756 [Purpureocillium lilacinum]|uniref:Uncharacterized protein n=1 Tax=Purpureocillium lilacinum TaxID=33203 RepID=A0A179EW26_PURLI|nr:hypothetical protein VFPBJ_11756 [Purpureocillium lilacinum]